MYKRILVPTDGSETAMLAVEAALYLARSCGSEIVAFAVACPQAYLGGAERGLVSGTGPMAEALLREADGHAESVATRARAAGVPCDTETAYSLSPGEAIIAAASARQCDLIVMGSHGVRGLTAEIAGSVTRHVLAYSAVPVMVLRPPRDDAPVAVGQGEF